VTAFDERGRERASDEAGSARQEHPHPRFFPSLSWRINRRACQGIPTAAATV